MNKKKSTIKNFLPIIIGAFVGLILGVSGGDILPSNINIVKLLIYFLISMGLGSFIQIIFHELGHLILGLVTGYEFVSFRIGGLTIIKIDGKLKLKRYGIEGTGGQCLLSPPDLDEYNNYPNFLYNLGGGLMNLLLALVFFLLVKNNSLNDFPYVFSIVMIVIGIFFAVTNLIPLKINGIANDGYNIIMLSKDEAGRLGLWKQLKIHSLLANNIRIKDIDEDYFNFEKEIDWSNPLVNSLLVMKVDYYVDSSDYEKAEKLMDKLLKEENILEIHRNELICSKVFLQYISGRTEEARLSYGLVEDYIDRTKKYFISRRRLMYGYYLLVEDDKFKANKEIESFNSIIKHYPYLSEIDSEKELIGYIDEVKKHTL